MRSHVRCKCFLHLELLRAHDTLVGLLLLHLDGHPAVKYCVSLERSVSQKSLEAARLLASKGFLVDIMRLFMAHQLRRFLEQLQARLALVFLANLSCLFLRGWFVLIGAIGRLVIGAIKVIQVGQNFYVCFFLKA